MKAIERLGAVLLLCLVAACGGSTGFSPVITGVKVQSIRYGHTATILIGGKYLVSSLEVDTAGACSSPSFASASTTELLVLNCNALVVGDFNLTLKSAQGEVLHSAIINVPKPQVLLLTSLGNITLELSPEVVPLTVNNFLTYVNKSFYSNTLFHRVIPGFVVQGGGYTTGLIKKSGQLAPIALESNKGLLNTRGTVAMARTNLFNSATSEFFVNLVDNTFLDYRNAASPGYAVFGRVIEGMDVVDLIAGKTTGVFNGFSDVPVEEVSVSLAVQVK